MSWFRKPRADSNHPNAEAHCTIHFDKAPLDTQLLQSPPTELSSSHELPYRGKAIISSSQAPSSPYLKSTHVVALLPSSPICKHPGLPDGASKSPPTTRPLTTYGCNNSRPQPYSYGASRLLSRTNSRMTEAGVRVLPPGYVYNHEPWILKLS